MAKKQQTEGNAVEKEMTTIREESLQREVIRKKFRDLVSLLESEGSFSISGNQVLLIEEMEVADFLDASTCLDLTQRINVLAAAFNRFGLDVIFEGSIGLGEFNIAGHAWNIYPGKTGSLEIKASPAMLSRSIDDLVNFLKYLPRGQGFSLKPGQSLLVRGLSKESMMDYYEKCKDDSSVEAKDKGQDELFEANCKTLAEENLLMKVYGVEALQVDRSIDVALGGIVYKASPAAQTPASLVLVLFSKPGK